MSEEAGWGTQDAAQAWRTYGRALRRQRLLRRRHHRLLLRRLLPLPRLQLLALQRHAPGHAQRQAQRLGARHVVLQRGGQGARLRGRSGVVWVSNKQCCRRKKRRFRNQHMVLQRGIGVRLKRDETV